MPAWLTRIRSLTSDLGTESGILQFEADRWQSLMPTWMGLDDALEPDGADHAGVDVQGRKSSAQHLFATQHHL